MLLQGIEPERVNEPGLVEDLGSGEADPPHTSNNRRTTTGAIADSHVQCPFRFICHDPTVDSTSACSYATPNTCSYATPNKRSVLIAIGRRLAPSIVEATLIPTALFYLAYQHFGIVSAYVVTLVWSLLSVARRNVQHQPIPAIVLLAGIGIAARTIIAIASRNSFVYFFQPIIGKTVLAAVFFISVAAGRPLITRFSGDFCSMTPELAARPGIVSLYRRLTLLWATVNLLAAILTLAALLTLPTGTFIALRSMIGWALTIPAIIATVSSSVHTARAEGLLVAISPAGALNIRS